MSLMSSAASAPGGVRPGASRWSAANPVLGSGPAVTVTATAAAAVASPAPSAIVRFFIALVSSLVGWFGLLASLFGGGPRLDHSAAGGTRTAPGRSGGLDREDRHLPWRRHDGRALTGDHDPLDAIEIGDPRLPGACG